MASPRRGRSTPRSGCGSTRSSSPRRWTCTGTHSPLPGARLRAANPRTRRTSREERRHEDDPRGEALDSRRSGLPRRGHRGPGGCGRQPPRRPQAARWRLRGGIGGWRGPGVACAERGGPRPLGRAAAAAGHYWGWAMIPADVIEDVKARVDVLEVIGRHVQLRKSGTSFVGRCPFHEEKTGSFRVYPNDKRWRCYGCSKHGDVFQFFTYLEGKRFDQVVRELAAQVNVTLPGSGPLSPAQQRGREERLVL